MKSSITTKLIAIVAVILLLTISLCSCGTEELQKQIDEVKNSVTTAQTTADGAKTAADDAKAQITAAKTEAADALAAAQTKLNDAITAANAAIAEKAAIADITSAKTELSAAIEEAKTAVNATTAELQGIVEKAVADNATAISDLRAALEAQIAANAADDAETAKTLSDAIVASEDACKTLVNDKVVELKALIGKCVTTETFNAKVAELLALIGANADDIDDIKTNYATLAKLANEVSTLNARITGEVDTLEGTIASEVADLYDKIAEEVDTLNDTIDDAVALLNDVDEDLQNQIDEIVAAIADDEDDIETLKGQVKALEDANADYAAALVAVKTSLIAITDKYQAVNEDLYSDDKNAEIKDAYFLAFAAALRAMNTEEAEAAYTDFLKVFDPEEEDYIDNKADEVAIMLAAIYADDKFTIDENEAAEEVFDYIDEYVGYWNAGTLKFLHLHVKNIFVDTEYAEGVSVKAQCETLLADYNAANQAFADFAAAIEATLYTVYDDEIIDEDEILAFEGISTASDPILVAGIKNYLDDTLEDYPEYEAPLYELDSTLWTGEKLGDVLDAAFAAKDAAKAGAEAALVIFAQAVKDIGTVDITKIDKIEIAETIREATIVGVSTYRTTVAQKYTAADLEFEIDDETEYEDVDLLNILTTARETWDDLNGDLNAKIAHYAVKVDAARTAAEAAKTDISETGLIAKILAAENYYNNSIATITSVEDKAFVDDAIESFSNEDISEVLENTYEDANLPELLAGYREFYEGLYSAFQEFAAAFTAIIEEIGTVDDVTLADGTALIEDAFSGYVYWQSNVTNIDTLDIPVGTLDPMQPISYYVTLYNNMLLKYADLKADYQADALAFIAAVNTMKTNAGADYATVLAVGTELANLKEDKEYFDETEVVPTFNLDATTAYSVLIDAIADYEAVKEAYDEAIAALLEVIDDFNADLDAILEGGITCTDREAFDALTDDYLATLTTASTTMIPAIVVVDEETTINLSANELADYADTKTKLEAIEAKRNALVNAIDAVNDKLDEYDVNAATRYFLNANDDYIALVATMSAKYAVFAGIEEGNITGGEITIKDDYNDTIVRAAKVSSVLNAQAYADEYEAAIPEGAFKTFVRTYLENALYTQTTTILATTITDVEEIAAMGADTKINEILEKVYFEKLNANAGDVLDAFIDAACVDPLSASTATALAAVDGYIAVSGMTPAEQTAFLAKLDADLVVKYFKAGAMIDTIRYYANVYMPALELVDDADIKSATVKNALATRLQSQITFINDSTATAMTAYLELCDAAYLKGIFDDFATQVYNTKLTLLCNMAIDYETDAEFFAARIVVLNYISKNYNATAVVLNADTKALVDQVETIANDKLVALCNIALDENCTKAAFVTARKNVLNCVKDNYTDVSVAVVGATNDLLDLIGLKETEEVEAFEEFIEDLMSAASAANGALADVTDETTAATFMYSFGVAMFDAYKNDFPTFGRDFPTADFETFTTNYNNVYYKIAIYASELLTGYEPIPAP